MWSTDRTVVRRWARKRLREKECRETVCPLLGSVLGRRPFSSATFHLCSDNAAADGGERGGGGQRMLFGEDLSSLATQLAQEKGGDSCEDRAGRTDGNKRKGTAETRETICYLLINRPADHCAKSKDADVGRLMLQCHSFQQASFL